MLLRDEAGGVWRVVQIHRTYRQISRTSCQSIVLSTY